MRINVYLLSLIVSAFVVPFLAHAQDEETEAFREPLYFSEVDKDQRTPQAVRVGGVVFVSAMSGPGETVEDQVRSTYIRLQSVLGNYGLTMANVAQERIYLLEGQSYNAVAGERLRFYGEMSAPASTLVEVAGFAAAGTLVSIEMIAVAGPDLEEE